LFTLPCFHPIYLKVFIVYLNIFECIYSIFMVCFNLFIICFNVFWCIWKYLNVFIDIIIGISPSYSHKNIFAMRTHVHICFLLSTMTTFLICYTTIFHIPHSMSSLVAQSIVEPKYIYIYIYIQVLEV
jgi:hypothetical protein